MYYETTKKVYFELAKKYDLNYRIIADICRAPLEFVGHVMSNVASKETDVYPSIRITGLGVFYVKYGKQRYLKSKEVKERIHAASKRKAEREQSKRAAIAETSS